MSQKKLAIVVSHPIQYYAPLFAVLASAIELKVFYCHNPTPEEVGKDGFGKSFSWDVELLKGYEFEFLENVSKNPSVTTKDGCDTPSIGTRLEAYGATHVVVFGWYLKSHLQALRFCNKQGIPIAARGDSQLDPTQHWLKRLVKKMYYPYFLKKYDAFLSVGKRNRAYLESYGVGSDKIKFSPHAIDQSFWKIKKQKQEVPTFLWVGKFTPKKRPFDVIKAFKMALLNPSLEIKLIMVGSGELFNDAKKIAGNVSNIEFAGFKNQTELKPIYAQSNVLLLTSGFQETWGLVVNEAFSIGLPAIVSSAAGCSEDLIKGSTGDTYPLGDIAALSHLIQKWAVNVKEDRIQGRVDIDLEKINKIFSFESNIKSFDWFMSNY